MENVDKEKYYRAVERLKEQKKFYEDVLKYVVIVAFLAGLNYYTNQWTNKWFLWVAFGWGFGLLMKALKIFKWNPLVSKDWEERKLKEFMKEENDTSLQIKNRWE